MAENKTDARSKTMFKILGGVFIGIFVGALTFEILCRKSPQLIRQIEKAAENSAHSFFKAFEEGYRPPSNNQNLN
jgi:hypothetical protein